jgi:hypothetical protein
MFSKLAWSWVSGLGPLLKYVKLSMGINEL